MHICILVVEGNRILRKELLKGILAKIPKEESWKANEKKEEKGKKEKKKQGALLKILSLNFTSFQQNCLFP